MIDIIYFLIEIIDHTVDKIPSRVEIAAATIHQNKSLDMKAAIANMRNTIATIRSDPE
jgi:hypothetical protein